jgi:hypothetical protein
MFILSWLDQLSLPAIEHRWLEYWVDCVPSQFRFHVLFLLALLVTSLRRILESCAVEAIAMSRYVGATIVYWNSKSTAR